LPGLPAGLWAAARRWAGLERRLRAAMDAACGPVCAACPSPCCRPEMCAEAAESPWLLLVRAAAGCRARWLAGRGFLGAAGCRLAVGRPPVCAEFLCARLDRALGPEARRLQAMARTLTAAGERALGGEHLVEILTPERLAAADPARLAARLEKAGARLAGLQENP
jgi:hypothetical protein